jgi:hypothetical protein
MLTRLFFSIILIFYTEVASTSTLLITVITFVTTILFDHPINMTYQVWVALYIELFGVVGVSRIKLYLRNPA